MSTENVLDIFALDGSELSKTRRYMNSMMRYHFHTIRRELCLIEENAQWNDEVLGQLRLYEMELRIHERFSQWVAECKRFIDFHSSAEKKFRQIWSQQREGLSQRIGGSVTNWDSFACDLDINLEDSKLVIEECCKGLLSSSDDMLLPSNKRVAQFDEGLIFSLDAVISNLKDLLSYRASEAIPPNDQIDTLEIKLVFLRNYLKVTKMCIYNEDFQKLKQCIYLFANNAICQTFIYWVKKAAGEYNASEMDLMLSDILLRVKPCRLDVMDSYFPVLRYKGSVKDDVERYLDAIVNNLNDLIRLKAGKIVPLMKQIEILKHKLMFLQKFIILAAHCVNSRDFQKLMNYVHDFSKNAVQLTFLYWLKAGDEHTISEMICKICDTIQKIEPCTREVTNVYFGILKSMMLRRSDNPYLVQVVVSFVDLLLQKLLTVEGFHILRDGLIFVLSFIANPPIENANDDELSLVLQEIDVLLLERWHLIWSVDMKDFIEKEVHNFQQEIEIVNARIRQRYCKYQYSSIHDFPRIIGLGFLDLLIRNLRNMKEELSSDTNLLSFVKYSIWKIEEELVLIRPFFNDTLELQNDNTSRLQLIDLAYLTERVVCSCFVFDYPIWYRLGCLHDLLNKIKVVKTKTEQVKGFKVYNVGVLPFSGTSTGINSKQTWTSDINQVVVGFEDDTNTIIDELIYGNKSLDIVSIVGMAGLGKTTLAKKVYGAPSVKSHFHIFAFCSVSRYYDAKRLLLDILGNIIVIDDVSNKKDYLPLQLWKCLKGRRYLIVMDDIWEVRVWNDIKSSFPDDQNGSRVMFTTRFHNVARDAQIKFSPYHLAFLSEEKSWELLQKKAFSNGSCPPDLYDIGKLIAKNCKGLPLAVVLISGLLSRTECSLSWWNEIAERVVSYISEEGCIKMLEFTYKYLPEYLKPLLLYFGAFPEDMSISVKNLIYLWIDEGFVRESNTKSLEDTAKDYLHDLVDRSLIIVTGRCSTGGIKIIGIHDLIHDFCRTKAQGENLFWLTCGNALSVSSDNPIYNHYRVCMETTGETASYTTQMTSETISNVTPFPCVRSLLSFQRCNYLFDTFSITRKYKLFLNVLHLENMWLEEYDLIQISLVIVDLRHLVAPVNHLLSVPSSISNLWALETFILRPMMKGEIRLPETIWKMKWLKHVNIGRCKLSFSDTHGDEVYSKLDTVESFASPTLSTNKDLERLLQRFPNVQKLGCHFNKSCDYFVKQIETLDFLNQIESLNLAYIGDKNPYVIKFPSSLKKLKLVGFKLPWTDISCIGELQHLEVLKLLLNSFSGPVWEMEEVVFPSLKFLKMNGLNLVHWDAFSESFPCLEQLLIMGCDDLVEIPSCFGVIPTLKRFEVHVCKKATESAREIVNEQLDMGNDTLVAEISY